MVQVPRAAIGQAGGNVALDFHWADNIGDSGNISEFFTKGDSAPDRRFNYRFGAATPGPVWDFDTEGFPNGWAAGPGVAELRTDGGSLVGRITAARARIERGRYPGIDAASNPFVILRMKVSAGRQATLSWGGTAGSVAFPIHADGKFHNYVVDMRQSPAWRGWVNTLRLSPSDATAGTFEITRLWVRPRR
jgi:hypothetical protein